MRHRLLPSVLTMAGAIGLLGLRAQDPSPPPKPVPTQDPSPPPPPPKPAPAQDTPPPPKPAPAPAPKAAANPLTMEALDTLLVRAEQNLLRHGLSLDPRQLQMAAADYRMAVEGMPESADGDRRFTALFGLAFSLARMDMPADPKAREERGKETFDILDRASRLESKPPGLFAANPGLWIVDGIMQEQVGDYVAAMKQITMGFAQLEEDHGLQPWQVYQLRLFGLLSRGRAYLQPPLNKEELALKDFKEAEKLAAEALKAPIAPRDNRLMTSILTHKAAAYQNFDYYEEAEKVLQVLLRTDPDNSIHPYNMGLVKAIQQKYPEALAWYRKSAELNRMDPRPHLKIAFILLRYPDPGKEPDTATAVREGEIYLEHIGKEPDAEYLALRGEAAFLRKDMGEAETWFRKSMGIDPACRTALQRLIIILGQKEDPTDAVQKEIESLRLRLQDATKKDDKGTGMETKKTDMTFR